MPTNKYIYGLHDRGGHDQLKHEGEARGWVLHTAAISETSQGVDMSQEAGMGLGTLVRLNWGYGSTGTIPPASLWEEFYNRVRNYIATSKGVNHWIIGNEMNFSIEWPNGVKITPRIYADCFVGLRNRIRREAGDTHKFLTGAIGPWNPEGSYGPDPKGKYDGNILPGGHGDYIVYFTDLLNVIGADNLDGVCIHAYTHGYDPQLIYSMDKMGPPFQAYYYHMKTYIDQCVAIPKTIVNKFARVGEPFIYLTEMNGDRDPDGSTWPSANGWIQSAYGEIDWWNTHENDLCIACAILFRWMNDPVGWGMEHKGDILGDLRQAVARGYKSDKIPF